jgi:hypothetical protein
MTYLQISQQTRTFCRNAQSIISGLILKNQKNSKERLVESQLEFFPEKNELYSSFIQQKIISSPENQIFRAI